MSGLDSFFRPKSIVVIGASTKPGKIGHEVLRNVIRSFRGEVFAVNPRAEEILGVPSYPSVREAPPAEMAVITLPARAVPQAVKECGEKGCKAVVVISGGFAELGDEGRRHQEEMVLTARRYGIRVIGPNCIGIYSPSTGVDTSFQPVERMLKPGDGNIAFTSQSGTYAIDFLERLAHEGLGVRYGVSLGNRADVDEADLIELWKEDDSVRVISSYMETLTDGRRLYEAVIRLNKPFIVYKSGRTVESARAASSHTGRIAGSYKVFESALRQAGALVVDSFMELYESTKAISLSPTPKGSRTLLITNGAGPCVSSMDLLYRYGFTFPRSDLGNPIDLTGSARTQDYLKAMKRAKDYDLILVYVVYQDSPLEEEFTERLLDEWDGDKPLLVYASGVGPYTMEKVRELHRSGVPAFTTAEGIAWGARALLHFRKFGLEAAHGRKG